MIRSHQSHKKEFLLSHFFSSDLFSHNVKLLIYGQIHFMNQILQHQIRCLHDHISLMETDCISFKEMDPFEVGVP